MMKDSAISEKVVHESAATQATHLSDSQSEISTVPTAKTARLTVAEKAYVRGMLALRDQNYSEGHRQLSGYLKLIKSRNPQAELTCQVLSLYLAISQEIAIIESEVG